MASKHKSEETKNEGPIATRLRSSFKIGDAKKNQTTEGKTSQLSKQEKQKGIVNKSLAEKLSELQTHEKKSNDSSKPNDENKEVKDLSSKNQQKQPVANKGKEKETEKKQAYTKSLNERPVYYIRWKGIENTRTCWTCALCQKDTAYLEEQKDSIEHEENDDQLQYYLFSSQGREDRVSKLLPEVAVLPCTHVFHGKCLSELQLSDLNDPSCPICISMCST